MKDFRQLKVWEKAHALTLNVYKATRGFPPKEQFGLTSQLRRAAFSIPSNIAEGCGRDGDRELARFLEIAMGSASETEYQLQLARDLGCLGEEHWRSLNADATEVKKMLASLRKKIRSSQRSAVSNQ